MTPSLDASTRARDKLPGINRLHQQLKRIVEETSNVTAEAPTSKRLALRAHRLQFAVFLKQLIHKSELVTILTSPVYTVRDVAEMNMRTKWLAPECIGDTHHLLFTFWTRHNPDKTAQNQQAALHQLANKYWGWEILLFQRLYRKYCCSEYPVTKDPDVCQQLCPGIVFI